MQKRCITLIGRFLIIGIALVSTVLSPIGYRVKASEENGEVSYIVKEIEENVYKNKAINMFNESSPLKLSSNIMLGDVNNDGQVNSIDYAYMKMYLLGMKGGLIIENNISVADLNMDGKFDSIDLAIMKGYLLGKIKGLPIGDNTASPKPPSPTSTPTPLPSPTESSDKDDFTNNIINASYLVAVGEEVHGKINYAGDEDYMLFVPPTDGRYRVEIYTNVETSVAYLYTEKIEGLKHHFNSFGTYTSKEGYYYIQEYLTGGTKYYLGVKNRKDKVSLDSYVIKISKLN